MLSQESRGSALAASWAGPDELSKRPMLGAAMHFPKLAVVEATCIALCADSHWRGFAAVARRNVTKVSDT